MALRRGFVSFVSADHGRSDTRQGLSAPWSLFSAIRVCVGSTRQLLSGLLQREAKQDQSCLGSFDHGARVCVCVCVFFLRVPYSTQGNKKQSTICGIAPILTRTHTRDCWFSFSPRQDSRRVTRSLQWPQPTPSCHLDVIFFGDLELFFLVSGPGAQCSCARVEKIMGMATIRVSLISNPSLRKKVGGLRRSPFNQYSNKPQIRPWPQFGVTLGSAEVHS